MEKLKAKIEKALFEGGVYAKVNHISKSGALRKLSFYLAVGNKIINITPFLECFKNKDFKLEQLDLSLREVKLQGVGFDVIYQYLVEVMQVIKPKSKNIVARYIYLY